MNILKRAGQRIKETREAKGLNQKEFAALVGVAQSTLSELENGRSKFPSGRVLVKMAEVLGVSQAWIITGEDGEIAIPTDEESAMLSAFRTLSPSQQVALMEYVKSISSNSNNME